MVSAVGARVQSKGSKKPKQRKLAIKECPFCGHEFYGVKQATFCSDYCVQQACRRRREALIEAFADLLLMRSQELTLAVYGVAVQATKEQALRKATECIEQNHLPFKLKLSAIGYVYNERERQWFLRAQLPPMIH